MLTVLIFLFFAGLTQCRETGFNNSCLYEKEGLNRDGPRDFDCPKFVIESTDQIWNMYRGELKIKENICFKQKVSRFWQGRVLSTPIHDRRLGEYQRYGRIRPRDGRFDQTGQHHLDCFPWHQVAYCWYFLRGKWHWWLQDHHACTAHCHTSWISSSLWSTNRENGNLVRRSKLFYQKLWWTMEVSFCFLRLCNTFNEQWLGTLQR